MVPPPVDYLDAYGMAPAVAVKIGLFPRYDRLGASSRLRLFQYEGYLLDKGVECERAPLFSDQYLSNLYEQRGKALSGVSQSYFLRVRATKVFGGYDLLWIEKEALPWVPWGIERLVLPRGVPFAVDFDDAVFHRYDLHRSRVVRWLLGQKLDRLMAAATLVTAGNQYLADRAKRAGAAWVEIVPTVVDAAAYSPSGLDRRSGTPVIGWIGSPSTWDAYMVPMMPLLTGVAQAEAARIHAVGSGVGGEVHPVLDRLPWTEQTEVAQLQEMDVGIMPLTDTPWARGKCGYKLIQYMACGLPVVASPVGVNCEIVEDGVNGFLAETEAEWRAALTRLLRDPDLRRRMGQAGRAKVEARYSLQVWGPRVAEMLMKAAGKGAA